MTKTKFNFKPYFQAHQCYQEQPGSEVCHVFPLPLSFAPRPQKLKFHPKSRFNRQLRKRNSAKTFSKARSESAWCNHPLLQSICDYIDKFVCLCDLFVCLYNLFCLYKRLNYLNLSFGRLKL